MIDKIYVHMAENRVSTFGMCRFHNPDCLSDFQHSLEYQAFEGLVVVGILHEDDLALEQFARDLSCV